jgi:3'(2'), 5'-bisphosphate nucleotidase
MMFRSSAPAIFSHRNALVNQLKRLALEAGALALEDFDETGSMASQKNFSQKEDGSPVTETDFKVQEFLNAGLQNIAASIPIIAEEQDQTTRTYFSDEEYVWVVDPIDGTRDYIEGSKDFTINIGLLHHQRPILGVIYAPAWGELYAGFTNDKGDRLATRWLEDTDIEKDIRVRSAPREGLIVVTGKVKIGGKTSARIDAYAEQFKIQKLIRRGSSIKLCLIASGKADLYPRFGKSSIWDIAAGQAILEAAGGKITDFNGQDIPYPNQENKFENPEFVAWSNRFDLFEKD